MDNHIMAHGFGTKSHKNDEDLVLVWNSRDKSNSENKRRGAARQNKNQSKSQDSKKKQTKSQPRSNVNRMLFKEQANLNIQNMN